jgi:hypothetical protein
VYVKSAKPSSSGRLDGCPEESESNVYLSSGFSRSCLPFGVLIESVGKVTCTGNCVLTLLSQYGILNVEEAF